MHFLSHGAFLHAVRELMWPSLYPFYPRRGLHPASSYLFPKLLQSYCPALLYLWPSDSPLTLLPSLPAEIKNSLNVCSLLQSDIVSHIDTKSEPNVLRTLCLQQAELLKRAKALLSQQSTFESILNNTYVLRSNAVDLAGLKNGLQAYGGDSSIITTCEKINTPSNDEAPATLFNLDDRLAYHIISNLIDNANKYGGHLTPLSIDLTLSSTWDCENSVDGHCIFDFSSSEKEHAVPTEPAETTARVLHIHVSNPKGENHEELRQCSPSQLKALFVKGARGSFQNSVPSAESCGHGSWIMMKCLAALGGRLLMAVGESNVCMQIVLPVCTTICEITPSSTLRIAVLDDSSLQRKMMKRVLFQDTIGDSNVSVHGATMEEIKAFPSFVLRHQPPFTAIIVDQHLGKDENHQMVKGTDIVKTLRTKGCTATILINSANGDQHDVEEYLRAGADAYLNKDSSPACVRQTILKLLCVNRNRAL
jgi:CheY-like chemotaxis protein